MGRSIASPASGTAIFRSGSPLLVSRRDQGTHTSARRRLDFFRKQGMKTITSGDLSDLAERSLWPADFRQWREVELGRFDEPSRVALRAQQLLGRKFQRARAPSGGRYG